MKDGRNIEHERRCVAAVRQRRAAEGRPPANWVMDCYKQAQRIARFNPEVQK